MLGKRQQRRNSGALDAVSQPPLVFRAGAGAFSRSYFILMGQKIFQNTGFLKINKINIIGAEITLSDFQDSFSLTIYRFVVSHRQLILKRNVGYVNLFRILLYYRYVFFIFVLILGLGA